MVGMVAMAIVGAIGSARRQRARDAALQSWAGQRGFRFRRETSASLDVTYPQFACLRVGDRRRTERLLEGEADGRRVRCFDHHYRTQRQVTERVGGGRGRPGRTRTRTVYTQHRFSAVVVEVDFPLGRLLLRREGVADRVSSFFGRNDLDFESAAFSRRYHVSADEPKWAYDVLDVRTMERLMQLPDVTLEMEASALLVLRERTIMNPAQYEEALAAADALLDGVPGFRKPAGFSASADSSASPSRPPSPSPSSFS